MRYQHIFFDLDHTLWDFEANAGATLRQLYSEFELQQTGIPDFDDFYKKYAVHNDRLWERFRKGYIKREELRWKRMWLTLLDYKIANEKLSRDLGARFLEVLPTQTTLFPGALEVLDHLREKRYPLHLITNGFEETQYQKMNNAGITNYFTHVVTSEVAGCLKPHPEIFEYALRKAQGDARDTIMIGDALEVDILGAQRAGMDQVYFNPAVPATAITPTYTIGHLLELKDIL